MLLHTLRHSRTLVRMVLVWFVLAMGLAVAAPAVQPIALDSICSAASAADAGAPQPDGDNTAGLHHSLQCVMCLAVGAPPSVQVDTAVASPDAAVLPTAMHQAVVLAQRQSPLAARAPPAL